MMTVLAQQQTPAGSGTDLPGFGLRAVGRLAPAGQAHVGDRLLLHPDNLFGYTCG